VNEKPARSRPNTASEVWPTSGLPAARTVAESCDIDRPRRSTATSTVTGPAGTGAAYTVVSERRLWAAPDPAPPPLPAADPASTTPSARPLPARSPLGLGSRPSSSSMARAAMADMTPPWGTVGQFQPGLTSTR
jgi:hypothetical protein